MLKLFTISPFCVYPPKTGGPMRIFYINRGLARSGWKVFQFSGSTNREGGFLSLIPKEKEIYSNYIEYKNFNLLMHYFNRLLTVFSNPVMGFAIFPKILFNPKVINQQLSQHRYIMLEFPYLYYQIKNKITKEQKLILNAHNIEYKLYQNINTNNPFKKWLVKILFQLEKKSFQSADISFVCSEEDRQTAINIYGANPKKIHVAPNGVNINSTQFTTDEKRKQAKRTLNLENKIIAIFIGSKWKPNNEAVKEIITMAKRDKDIHYLVVGGVGNDFKQVNISNISFTGFVDDLSLYLSAADIAINPMISGSGTNIKMFEYLATGLPVVSSNFGARGLVDKGSAVFTTTLNNFPEKIKNILKDKKQLKTFRHAARKMVEESYDWTNIAKQMSTVILGKNRA